MLTSSIVPPPVSPAAPAMPPPVPCGSMLKPRTSLPSSRSITSALLSVSVGLLAASAQRAAVSRADGSTQVAASPISLSPAFRSIPGRRSRWSCCCRRRRRSCGWRRMRSRPAASVSNGVVGRCRCCPRVVVVDVPDAAVIAIVTRPVSVLSPGPVASGRRRCSRRSRWCRCSWCRAGSKVKSPSAWSVTVPPSLVANVPPDDRQRVRTAAVEASPARMSPVIVLCGRSVTGAVSSDPASRARRRRGRCRRAVLPTALPTALVGLVVGDGRLVEGVDGDREVLLEEEPVRVGRPDPDRVARLRLEVDRDGRPQLPRRDTVVGREGGVVGMAGEVDERVRVRVAGVRVGRRQVADGRSDRDVLVDAARRQRQVGRRVVGRRRDQLGLTPDADAGPGNVAHAGRRRSRRSTRRR